MSTESSRDDEGDFSCEKAQIIFDEWITSLSRYDRKMLSVMLTGTTTDGVTGVVVEAVSLASLGAFMASTHFLLDLFLFHFCSPSDLPSDLPSAITLAYKSY